MKKFILILFSLFTIIVNAQEIKKVDFKEYSEIERKYSRIILDIEEKIFGADPDYESLTMKLDSIISDIPADYTNSFENGGKTYIKFWNSSEYKKYMETAKAPIVGLQNVYPYACYLSAVVKIEMGLFEEALSILNKGIDLESDQPKLLNELGFLYTNIGGITKDTTYLNISNNVYLEAVSSRSYNTNRQKARSLRGIGYNLIELADFESSKLFYEKSLDFEESDNARNELKLIEDKLSNEQLNIYSYGSNLNKSDKVYSYAYYVEQENKLPKSLKEKIPNKYVYLWSKASIYLSAGSEKFRIDDYFNYPLKEWDISQIDAGVLQIVQYLRGIAPERYIEIKNLSCAEHLLLTFHFEKQEIKELGDNISEITFRHKMDKDEIVMYFRFNDKQKDLSLNR
ncbi:hypothetical protein D9V96_019560 [Zobellia laminariae]|uniref:hypothetical protein n=1 Tax=Zobellia laminariae TaxID=248906 RepID=UPI0012D97582|nr:hypothetical protein [Zobellia laminariae]